MSYDRASFPFLFSFRQLPSYFPPRLDNAAYTFDLVFID